MEIYMETSIDDEVDDRWEYSSFITQLSTIYLLLNSNFIVTNTINFNAVVSFLFCHISLLSRESTYQYQRRKTTHQNEKDI